MSTALRAAVSALAWNPEELDLALSLLSDEGVHYIEAVPMMFGKPLADMEYAEITEKRSQLNDQGFAVCAMQSLLFGRPEAQLFTAGEAGREAMRHHLVKIIKAASFLGAGPLVFGAPKQRRREKLSEEQAFDEAAFFFTDLAQIAADYGCVLCLEPNAAAYGCDFVLTHAEAYRLVRVVGHPGFGLQLDMGAFVMSNEIPMPDYMHVVRHTHLSLPNLEPLGTACQRDYWSELSVTALRLLTSAEPEYTGFVSIEMKAGENAADNFKQLSAALHTQNMILKHNCCPAKRANQTNLLS